MTTDLARHFGVPVWRIRRVLDAMEPPPRRAALYRIVDESDLPRIEAALAALPTRRYRRRVANVGAVALA